MAFIFKVEDIDILSVLKNCEQLSQEKFVDKRAIIN